MRQIKTAELAFSAHYNIISHDYVTLCHIILTACNTIGVFKFLNANML